MSKRRAVLEHRGSMFLERMAGRFCFQLQLINVFFAEIEADFLEERASYPFPETFDATLLKIVRNSQAAQLIVRCRPELAPFIWLRAAAPVELPQIGGEQRAA